MDSKIRIEFIIRNSEDDKGILQSILNYILTYDEIRGLMNVPIEELNNLKVIEQYELKNNKLRWDLVPWGSFEKVVEVITKGAKKYGIDNWKMIPSNIFDAALMRHYVSYKKGEHIDFQWNLPHLAHLVCNGLFLLWKECLVIEIEKRGELKSNEASKEMEKGGSS